MIKLIASDLDGTLLQNGAQTLTPRAVPLIRRLAACGIIFAAASGRQYPNLVRLFGEAAGDMAFLCENGAFVIYKDKIIAKSCMELADAKKLVEDILARGDCEVLISGESTSYMLPKNKSFLDHMQNTVKNNVRLIENLSDIPEEIIKVSAYRTEKIQEAVQGLTDNFGSRLKMTISGDMWLDCMAPGVCKGQAVRLLQESLEIKQEETMVFGDQLNDMEMLEQAYYSFAVANAREEVKKAARFHADSNVNGGVLKILKLLLS